MVNIEFFSPYKENVAIVGMAQEGKSNLLKRLLSLNPNPYTLFDTIGVMRNLKPLKPDVQRVVTPSYRQRTTVFHKVCKEVWKEGNQIFAIDEVHNFCDKYKIDPELDPIVNMGGNRNISYWITSRRVQQVHNDLLAQCKHHFIFRTYLPQDLEWYGKVVPKDIILLSKDLPNYHFIYYKLGQTPIVMKPVKDMSQLSLIRTYIKKESIGTFKDLQKKLGLNEYKFAQLCISYALKDPRFFEILSYVLKHKTSITAQLEYSLKSH